MKGVRLPSCGGFETAATASLAILDVRALCLTGPSFFAVPAFGLFVFLGARECADCRLPFLSVTTAFTSFPLQPWFSFVGNFMFSAFFSEVEISQTLGFLFSRQRRRRPPAATALLLPTLCAPDFGFFPSDALSCGRTLLFVIVRVAGIAIWTFQAPLPFFFSDTLV